MTNLTHPHHTGTPPERITIDGSTILDQHGQPLMLRGMTLGHFGETLSGDAQIVRSMNGNYVRLLARVMGDYGLSPDGAAVDGYDATAPHYLTQVAIDTLDSYVDWCEAAGVWWSLGVDSQCVQNSMQTVEDLSYCVALAPYAGTSWPNGRNGWTDPVLRARHMAVQRWLFKRYMNRRFFAFFEPIPEPGPPNVSQAEVTAFYVESAANLRTLGSTIPLLIGPIAYKIQNIANALIADGSPIVYTGNLFWYTAQTQDANVATFDRRLAAAVDFREKFNVPVLVDQYGVRTCEDPNNFYMAYGLNALVAAHMPFCVWVLRDGGGTPYDGGFGLYWDSRTHGWVEKQPYGSQLATAFAAPY